MTTDQLTQLTTTALDTLAMVTDPECMEAFRRREVAQEDFDEAWREALTTIH